MRLLLATFALLFSVAALAQPGTYNITPTVLSEDGSGGTSDGYRIYQGCDKATQAKGAVVADNATVGTQYSFTGDDTAPPVVCQVPFNSSGEGTFANVVRLDATQQVPGAGTLQLQCSFVTDTGEIYDCSGTVL